MPDYKAMYLRLFNTITDAVNILQEGQQEGEKAFIENEGEPILIPLKDLPDEE